MEIDFSGVNFEYLIHARDLARKDPELVAVLLGISQEFAHLLAQVTPRELAQLKEIRAPLLAPHLEFLWWQRLFRAVQEGRAAELEAIIEQACVMSTLRGKGE